MHADKGAERSYASWNDLVKQNGSSCLLKISQVVLVSKAASILTITFSAVARWGANLFVPVTVPKEGEKMRVVF